MFYSVVCVDHNVYVIVQYIIYVMYGTYIIYVMYSTYIQYIIYVMYSVLCDVQYSTLYM